MTAIFYFYPPLDLYDLCSSINVENCFPDNDIVFFYNHNLVFFIIRVSLLFIFRLELRLFLMSFVPASKLNSLCE